MFDKNPFCVSFISCLVVLWTFILVCCHDYLHQQWTFVDDRVWGKIRLFVFALPFGRFFLPFGWIADAPLVHIFPSKGEDDCRWSSVFTDVTLHRSAPSARYRFSSVYGHVCKNVQIWWRRRPIWKSFAIDRIRKGRSDFAYFAEEMLTRMVNVWLATIKIFSIDVFLFEQKTSCRNWSNLFKYPTFQKKINF